MTEPESKHTVFILGAAVLGAFIATGIGYFVRKEDKKTIDGKIQELQEEVLTLKKAVVSPERLSNLSQNLVEQTQQAQDILDSQVLAEEDETF